MKTSDKLGSRTLFAAGSMILFLLVIGGITERMLMNQKQLTAAKERRYQSYLLADELRQSSDVLTRLARTYVVTADPQYEEQCWAVLDIRNGKLPWPINYQGIYRDFMAVDGVQPRGDGKAVPLQQFTTQGTAARQS